MKNHGLISAYQFGFRSKHATTKQIHGIVEKINNDSRTTDYNGSSITTEAGRYC